MPVEKDVLDRNEEQARRLQAVVTGGADLTKAMSDGWTVSAALAHLAFWDRRAKLLLIRWVDSGTLPDQMDDDLLNNALLPEWLEIDPAVAGRMAVEAANAVNEQVAALADDMADSISMLGFTWLLDRAAHRTAHLDEIEAALGA